MESEKDFPGTVKKIAQMGYEGVEFAGYYKMGAKDLRKMLDDLGMKCFGTHTGINTLEGEEFQKTVDFNLAIGNKYLIVPGLPDNMRDSKESWIKTAQLFNALAKKLAPFGLRVGYHNHHTEFIPLDGEKPWDIFFRNTDKSVVMQIDTGNAMMGGEDPIALLKPYPGRTATVHMKEYSKAKEEILIGEGDVPWNALFDLCETTAATEYYIVEQENYPYPPLESVKRSLEGLKGLLAKRR
jgi:sugar phosphate isomerase/epimerase